MRNAEKELENKDKKDGLMNKMEAFQSDGNAQEAEKKEDELKFMKKEAENAKETEKNMKTVLKAHKQGHIMKGAIIEMDDSKFSGVQSKIYSVLENLKFFIILGFT